jgi:hypothetical protein
MMGYDPRKAVDTSPRAEQWPTTRRSGWPGTSNPSPWPSGPSSRSLLPEWTNGSFSPFDRGRSRPGRQGQEAGLFDEARRHSVGAWAWPARGSAGTSCPNPSIIPGPKAADILGIGQENIVSIPVRDDIGWIRRPETGNRPPDRRADSILAVVAVSGTTEEGAVDAAMKSSGCVTLRGPRRRFYLHIDAAYGGYARRSPRRNGAFIATTRSTAARQAGVLPRRHGLAQPRRLRGLQGHVRSGFDHRRSAQAGICPLRGRSGRRPGPPDHRLDLLFAAYVFEKTDDNPTLLGSYIMEGSKAGRRSRAAWMAHRVVPLNISGTAGSSGPASRGRPLPPLAARRPAAGSRGGGSRSAPDPSRHQHRRLRLP